MAVLPQSVIGPDVLEPQLEILVSEFAVIGRATLIAYEETSPFVASLGLQLCALVATPKLPNMNCSIVD